jgi:hypothetical protein
MEKIKYKGIEINIFEDKYWLNNGLTARFIYGKEVQDIYSILSKFMCDKIDQRINDFGHIFERTVCEHIILRAGNAVQLALNSPNINQVLHVDMKRKYCQEIDNFKADIVKAPCFDSTNEYRIDIFSDICAASGSTLEEWLIYLGNKYSGKLKKWWIILNMNVISIDAVDRIVKKIPKDVKLIIYCYGGLFNTYKQKIVLKDGEEIYPYTLINIYNDNHIVLPKTKKKIKELYQGNYNFLPDIVGECGEKIGYDFKKVLIYDLLEFYESGIDISIEPWNEKIKSALRKMGIPVIGVNRITRDEMEFYIKSLYDFEEKVSLGVDK